MQITSRFTIAVHLIACVECFKDTATVTSTFLAGSIGANPVIVRNVMSALKEAGILALSRGKRGMALARPLSSITFFDVYRAIGAVDAEGLFHFHEKANGACPVGRNIRMAMEAPLQRVQDAMEDEMKKISLEEVVARIRVACAEHTAGDAAHL